MRRVLCVLCALLMLTGCASAETAYPEMPEAAQALLERELDRAHTVGACVAVSQNGQLIGVYCRGTVSDGTAVTPDTAFRVGSISKMVSNVGLLHLMNEMDIALDDDIGDVLGFTLRHPGYPDTPITYRQLMTHTACLLDENGYDDAVAGNRLTLRTLLTDPAQHAFHGWVEPGTRVQYSNFGGGLIGSLIEALSGEPLDTYMEREVFAPLGITAAYEAAPLLEKGVTVSNVYNLKLGTVSAALSTDTERTVTGDPNRDFVYTAGKLLISAPDLCRVLMMLCDCEETVVPRALLREMTAAQSWRGTVACKCENGLFLNIISDRTLNKTPLYGHGGKAGGMVCTAYYDPERRICCVMLTNGALDLGTLNGLNILSRQVLRVCLNDVADRGLTVDDPYLVE